MSKYGPHPLPETVVRGRFRKALMRLRADKEISGFDRGYAIDDGVISTTVTVRPSAIRGWNEETRRVAVTVDTPVPDIRAAIRLQLELSRLCS